MQFKEKKALVTHHFKTGQNFVFKMSKFDKESNYLKRNNSRMNRTNLNTTINMKSTILNLSAIYRNILPNVNIKIIEKHKRKFV